MSQPHRGQSSKLTSNVPFGPSGYRCAACGVWVPNGTSHICSTYTPPQPYPQVTISPDPTQLRIAAALERIAAALEGADPSSPNDAAGDAAATGVGPTTSSHAGSKGK